MEIVVVWPEFLCCRKEEIRLVTSGYRENSEHSRGFLPRHASLDSSKNRAMFSPISRISPFLFNINKLALTPAVVKKKVSIFPR